MIRVFAKRELPVMDIIELQGRIVITPEALADARAAKEARRAARKQRRDVADSPRVSTAEKGSVRTSAGQLPSQQIKAENAPHSDATKKSELPPLSASMTTEFSSSSASSSDEDEDDLSYPTAEGRAVAENTQAKTELAAGHPNMGNRDDRADGASCVVEVPLGHVEQDHLSEKRCTLCIDTLRITGSRSTYKHPLLVLRECSEGRMRQLQSQLKRQRQHKEKEREGKSNAPTASKAVSSTTQAVAESEGSPRALSSSSSTIMFSEWLQRNPQALQLDSLYLDDMLTEAESATTTATTFPNNGNAGSHAHVSRKRSREKGEDKEGQEKDKHEQRTASEETGPASAPPSKPSVYKNYELVGVVRGSVLFNSKPARVFQ